MLYLKLLHLKITKNIYIMCRYKYSKEFTLGLFRSRDSYRYHDSIFIFLLAEQELHKHNIIKQTYIHFQVINAQWDKSGLSWLLYKSVPSILLCRTVSGIGRKEFMWLECIIRDFSLLILLPKLLVRISMLFSFNSCASILGSNPKCWMVYSFSLCW